MQCLRVTFKKQLAGLSRLPASWRNTCRQVSCPRSGVSQKVCGQIFGCLFVFKLCRNSCRFCCLWRFLPVWCLIHEAQRACCVSWLLCGSTTSWLVHFCDPIQSCCCSPQGNSSGLALNNYAEWSDRKHVLEKLLFRVSPPFHCWFWILLKHLGIARLEAPQCSADGFLASVAKVHIA